MNISVKTKRTHSNLSLEKSLCENKNIDGSRRLQPAITALFRNLKVATTDIFRILTQPREERETLLSTKHNMKYLDKKNKSKT